MSFVPGLTPLAIDYHRFAAEITTPRRSTGGGIRGHSRKRAKIAVAELAKHSRISRHTGEIRTMFV